MIYTKDSQYLNNLKNVAIFGSTGTIGSEFVKQIKKNNSDVTLYEFSRSTDIQNNLHYVIDFSNENSIIQAKNRIDSTITFDLIIIATGALHFDSIMPEKSLSKYTTENAQLYYLINTIGPSLIMKHFWPLLSKNKPSVIAALCARIGSIGDNRLGGWYSYRASKAALCMMIKSISIEIQRRNPNGICIGLHPGTVDSKLSQPFHKHIDPNKIMSPQHSVNQLLNTLSTLTIKDSGNQFAYDGTQVPY